MMVEVALEEDRPIWTVELAMRALFTLRVLSKVEEARTKMPLAVEVGVRAAKVVFSQAPLMPAAAPVMVIDPAPLPIVSPPAADKVAATGAAPVEPMRS